MGGEKANKYKNRKINPSPIKGEGELTMEKTGEKSRSNGRWVTAWL